VNGRLADAAHGLGHDAEVVDATRCVADCGAEPRLRMDGRELLDPPPDVVLARIGNWRPDSLLTLLETTVAAGCATPNPPDAIRTARDHVTTATRLLAAGLPVPDVVVGADPECLAHGASRLGLPVVVKQRRSRMGVGVIRCDTSDHLEAVLDSLWRVGDELLVQRFVDTAGVSVRLLVVGDRVVAAARFEAGPREWRSNAARGGVATRHHPSDREMDLALSAIRVLGLGHAGIDLLPAAAGPMVLEVNPTPGFRHLERATGVDVAAAIVSHAVACGA
jgi:RimK family alpha-L-glutamate ligase